MLPAKADPAEQRAFLENELLPRLEQARRGERVVWFVDASHFVWGVVLGFVWCISRLFLLAPAGRRRFNVLGALNAVTREVRWLSNTTGVNADTAVGLLKKLANSKEGPPVPGPPVTVVLDNGRYFKTGWVKTAALWYGIELPYLPGYSPNLNLIERLWKFVKGEALASRYHGDFAAFQQAIERCLTEAATTHREALASLLTLNFQSFEHVSTLAA